MEYNSRIPIYLQVIEDLKKRIITGDILRGDKLPSTRELAIEYEVNPNTAARIYKEMEQMDISYVERGKGTFVVDNDDLIPTLRREVIGSLVENFITQMNELGFTQEEIIDRIKEKGV